MFLRSFLQRKSKKDSEGSHSTSKGDKNAGKKNDPKLEVVKMTKMKSLPDNQEDSEVSGLKNHEARETSNASYDQTSHNEKKGRSSIESHPEEETAHLIPIPSSSSSTSSSTSSSSTSSSPSSSPQQQTPQFQTSLSISRDESESSQELLKVLVGQQGDGTFGETVDQYPSQSLHVEGIPQESMNESTLDDEEVSGSDSQVEELIKEVLKTVSRELQTEQLTADLEKQKLSTTTAVTTIQCEGSKFVGKSENTNGQSEIFHALTNGIIVNNPKREHEENRVGLFGEVASFETNRRQSGIAGRDVVSEGNFTLRTGQYEESKSITDTEVTKKEPDVVGGGSDISLSEPNVVINQESLIEDDWNPTSARDVTGQVTSSSSLLKGTLLFPVENDQVIHRRQLLETSSRNTNTACTSVLTTVKDSPTLSENLAAEVFLQTITSNICAKRDKKDVMPDADMIKTSSTVGSLKDDIVDNEIKTNSEENESIYYTIENLESSLDTFDDAKDSCSSNDRSNKVEEDVIVKSRLNVLACKFEMGKPYKCGTISNGPSAKAEEDNFKDILSIPYANSTPEKYTWSAYKDRVPRQTYSEEYFSPKSGFINGVSFCEMDCMTNNCSDWSQMHEVEDFNVYHKGKENSDIYDVNLPHNTCEDFVITPCQDSDTDDGEDDGSFEETAAKDHIEKRVPILGGNEDDSVGSSLEEIYNADNDDANTKTEQVGDRFQQQQQPAESMTSSAEEVATFTQSKEEKMIDLKNFEEFRKNNMLRAITNILVKVEGRLGNTVGTLKTSLEEFIKKTAILADEGQRTAPTEWEATEDEGELGLLDTRLRSSIDQQASLALSLKNTEERTRLMETQLEQWEVGEEDRKRQIISLREEVEDATARQRSLTVMLNDERRMKEALQLRVSTMTQEKQQLLFNNVMLWEQTSQLELKQEHFQSVSEQERIDLEEHTKALESELLALRSLKAGEPVKKISSESTCSISSDHTPAGSCTPKQDGDVENVNGHEARESSSRYMVPYDHPPQAPDDFPEGEFYGPVPYPHYRGSHRPNHNNSGYPFPPPRFPPPFARGSYPRRRGEHHRVHYNGMQPLPWYPNDRDDFHRERGRGQRPVRGRIFRGRGRGRGYGRGRRGRFHREGQS